MKTCDQIVDSIASDISSQFTLEPSDSLCTIRTPFLYPDNTPITLYAQTSQNGELVVSDLGHASDYAFINGIGERAIRRRIKDIERRFGLSITGDEIEISINEENTGEGIAILINAVQDIGYMVYQRPRRGQSRELRVDLEKYLVQHNRPYERDVVLRGRSRPRKVDYRVQGDGPKQLYLWVFDPAIQSAAKRADEISMSYIEVSGESEGSDPLKPSQFAVLVDSQTSAEEGRRMTEAVITLRNYVPHVVSWESRHEIDHLLKAA